MTLRVPGLVRLLASALVAAALLLSGTVRAVPERTAPDAAAALAFAIQVGGAQGLCGGPGEGDGAGALCLACILAAAMVPGTAAVTATPCRHGLPAFAGLSRAAPAGRDVPPCPPARGPPALSLDHA
jgi:hypothetical protein